jgi:hypothetical protein
MQDRTPPLPLPYPMDAHRQRLSFALLRFPPPPSGSARSAPRPSATTRPPAPSRSPRGWGKGVGPRLSLRDYVHQHKTEFQFSDVGMVLFFILFLSLKKFRFCNFAL